MNYLSCQSVAYGNMRVNLTLFYKEKKQLTLTDVSRESLCTVMSQRMWIVLRYIYRYLSYTSKPSTFPSQVLRAYGEILKLIVRLWIKGKNVIYMYFVVIRWHWNLVTDLFLSYKDTGMIKLHNVVIIRFLHHNSRGRY